MAFYDNDNLSIRGTRRVQDEASGTSVLHIDDPHALIQAAGYAKFVFASEDTPKHVFYRGQHRYYQGLRPSLFRDVERQATQQTRLEAMKRLIAQTRSSGGLFTSFPEEMFEPLLQHYGIRTSWVDLVDNAWIALWFACYRAYTTGKLRRYLHFERRLSRKEQVQERFAYIVLIGADAGKHASIPGLWQGETTEFVDLRVGVPSIFVRPHAQHGILFRLRRSVQSRSVDYHSAVVGALRIDLADAIDWLGEGRLLDVHSLFPPPQYDLGYGILLDKLADNTISPEPALGSLYYVFP